MWVVSTEGLDDGTGWKQQQQRFDVSGRLSGPGRGGIRGRDGLNLGPTRDRGRGVAGREYRPGKRVEVAEAGVAGVDVAGVVDLLCTWASPQATYCYAIVHEYRQSPERQHCPGQTPKTPQMSELVLLVHAVGGATTDGVSELAKVTAQDAAAQLYIPSTSGQERDETNKTYLLATP